MKILPVLFAALIALISFNTLAAQQIHRTHSEELELVGSVSVHNIKGSFDDVVRALAQQAEKKDAPYFRVVGVANPGNSSQWSGHAQLYR